MGEAARRAVVERDGRRAMADGDRHLAPAAPAHRRDAALSDVAYEKIKHRIITLAFRPGEHLNEARVCDALDIGRTPVHQAFCRLALEGMVEIIPRKGVIVRPVSLNEVMETKSRSRKMLNRL